jgi:hypothetical protein
VPKTLSVQIDDELYIQWQHALRNAAVELGVHAVSPSVVLRRLITEFCGSQRVPFDAGWLEGYKAGFGAVMRVFQDTLRRVAADPEAVPGLGIGMTSPHEDRGGE